MLNQDLNSQKSRMDKQEIARFYWNLPNGAKGRFVAVCTLEMGGCHPVGNISFCGGIAEGNEDLSRHLKPRNYRKSSNQKGGNTPWKGTRYETTDKYLPDVLHAGTCGERLYSDRHGRERMTYAGSTI